MTWFIIKFMVLLLFALQSAEAETKRRKISLTKEEEVESLERILKSMNRENEANGNKQQRSSPQKNVNKAQLPNNPSMFDSFSSSPHAGQPHGPPAYGDFNNYNEMIGLDSHALSSINPNSPIVYKQQENFPADYNSYPSPYMQDFGYRSSPEDIYHQQAQGAFSPKISRGINLPRIGNPPIKNRYGVPPKSGILPGNLGGVPFPKGNIYDSSLEYPLSPKSNLPYGVRKRPRDYLYHTYQIKTPSSYEKFIKSHLKNPKQPGSYDRLYTDISRSFLERRLEELKNEPRNPTPKPAFDSLIDLNPITKKVPLNGEGDEGESRTAEAPAELTDDRIKEFKRTSSITSWRKIKNRRDEYEEEREKDGEKRSRRDRMKDEKNSNEDNYRQYREKKKNSFIIF